MAKTKNTRKQESDAKAMTVGQVALQIAGDDDEARTKVAKKIRARIRSNFDALADRWPALKEQGKENRDGNRYPPMPRDLADEFVEKYTKA